GGNQTPAAFATYHSGFDMRNNIIINFPLVANTRSGAFATEDYYLRPVDKGPVRNTNNILINSHIGVKLPARFPYFALAGALWDPNGLWSSQADTLNYFVYNTPYFTFNEQVETVSPGAAAGGVIVKGPFYGFNDFEINRANDPQADLMALKVDRLNVSLDSVGNWTVQQAASASDLLAHMRHFATKRGGFYRLSFPTIAQVNDIAFTVENMLSMADSVVIGIEFNGSTSVEQVYISSFPNFMAAAHASWPTSFYNNPSAGSKHVFQAVNSMSALLNNTGMGAFWQDRTQNLVWIKLKGGLPMMWNEQQYEPFSEQRLYRKFGFRIVGNNATTWHGNISNQWENVQNWTNGLPDNTKDAIIPQALRMPILSNPTTIRSLTIDSAASLTLNATLTIQRNLTNFGVISGQGNTLMQGAGSIFNKQVLAGSGVVNNLTIQNAEGVEIVNTQGVLFGVNGRLQILSGSLITNNQLLLASNTQNDAQVGAINGSISGQVVYEKFIPQGRRAYRDLAIPVANAGSFFQNWQANGLNGILGTTITGAASPTAGVHPITGLDYTITGNNSLFQFQQATWQPITNTRLTSSIPYAGYRLLVRGNRFINMYQVPQPIVTNGPTILRTQGNIISGNVTLTTTGVQSAFPHSFPLTPGSGQFNFIANPYASIIDWHSVYQRSSNISANYWYLDPTFGLANRSVYVSYNALSGTNSNPLASQVGRYIQSGQAFFTQNSSNNAPVIRFTEADKSPDFINKGIFDISATQIPAVQLAIQKNDTIVDGTVALFSANFSNAIGAEDAIKLVNEHENMAFRAGGENLSIQARQHPDTLTALPLLFWQLKPNEHYQLAIKKQYFPNNSVQPFLHNSHTKQTIPITNETTFINLPTVQQINDTLKNLSIVFRQPTVLANTLLQLSMLQTSNSQQLVWQLTTNETVKHFEVLYAAENNEFSSIHIKKFIPNIFQYIHQQTSFPKGFYKIKLIHVSGEISYSNTVYHALATTKTNFTIMPNPVADNRPLIIAYTSIHNQKLVAQITNALGQIVYTTSLDVQANSGKWYIQQNLPKGTYRLTIFSDNNHLLESLKFIKQ
ncbi:MAG: T9SS type A sorting domain-containing protein, partial [Chitinophagaceae bacterium]